MRLSKALSVASVAVLAGALAGCSSSVPSQEAEETTEATEASTQESTEATETETEEPTQATAYAGEFAIPADTVFTQEGRSGVWFANEEHTIQCLIITDNADYDPFATCRVYPPFQVDEAEAQEVDCPAGNFTGTQATLTAEGAQMGNCQSDVPLQMMCLEGDAGPTDPLCARDWFATPVLPENTVLKAGDFECTLTGDEATCTHKDGETMTVAPGENAG